MRINIIKYEEKYIIDMLPKLLEEIKKSLTPERIQKIENLINNTINKHKLKRNTRILRNIKVRKLMKKHELDSKTKFNNQLNIYKIYINTDNLEKIIKQNHQDLKQQMQKY